MLVFLFCFVLLLCSLFSYVASQFCGFKTLICKTHLVFYSPFDLNSYIKFPSFLYLPSRRTQCSLQDDLFASQSLLPFYIFFSFPSYYCLLLQQPTASTCLFLFYLFIVIVIIINIQPSSLFLRFSKYVTQLYKKMPRYSKYDQPSYFGHFYSCLPVSFRRDVRDTGCARCQV